MSRKLIAFAGGLLLFANAFAGSGEDYAASAIPSLLLKNANAVIRVKELQFEIVAGKEIIEKNHIVVTILNENGDASSGFIESYGKLQDLVSVEGYLYDASGKQLKKIKMRDLSDESAIGNGTFMADTRIRHHNFYHRTYPYTVEYEWTVRSKNTIFLPTWQPQTREMVAVEKSVVTVLTSPGYNLRYKTFNIKNGPELSEEGSKKKYQWTLTNLGAISWESMAPSWSEITAHIDFAPSDFEIEDYNGSMNSWADVGRFFYTLKAGRDELPDAVKTKVHELADGKPKEEQIRLLYEYLQANTRYIGVQLGLGGWQPYDAKYVAAKGYGDCKALTNYMYSLLKEEGINSYYAMILAGPGAPQIDEDFPSSQFNHVILCVPMKKDSIWLECTSQITAAGFMGSFTDGRYALLADENGGHLVKTPSYTKEDNLQVRNIVAQLHEDATLTANINSIYRAVQQEEKHGLINSYSAEKVKEYLQEDLDFATYDINSFHFEEKRGRIPEIGEQLDITVSNYATITGKRIFIVPNIMTRSNAKYRSYDDRKFDVKINREYRDIDTVTISLPAGYSVEKSQEDEKIESKFGSYQSHVELADGKLIYTRKMDYYKGRFTAAEYADMVSFFEQVYRADRKKLVLVKTEQTAAPATAPKAF